MAPTTTISTVDQLANCIRWDRSFFEPLQMPVGTSFLPSNAARREFYYWTAGALRVLDSTPLSRTEVEWIFNEWRARRKTFVGSRRYRAWPWNWFRSLPELPHIQLAETVR